MQRTLQYCPGMPILPQSVAALGVLKTPNSHKSLHGIAFRRGVPGSRTVSAPMKAAGFRGSDLQIARELRAGRDRPPIAALVRVHRVPVLVCGLVLAAAIGLIWAPPRPWPLHLPQRMGCFRLCHSGLSAM